MRVNVAGVTFCNDEKDGGKSRQSILKELYVMKSGIITVDLKHTTYEGEPAIKCIEHSTKQCIGWIPKTKISEIKDRQMTGFINKSKIRYSISLDVQKKPSTKQYQMVKSVCGEMEITMPAYDVRAYTPIFQMVRNKK